MNKTQRHIATFPAAALLLAILLFPVESGARGDGLLIEGDNTLFPLGSYELPGDDAELAAMAEAGFNLFQCRDLEDLDRVQAVGAQGWVALPLEQGATDGLEERVSALNEHPALAVWHGPDEFVWHLTASSRHLDRYDIPTRRHWWNLEDNALEAAKEQARQEIPKLIEGIELLRAIDTGDRQIWFNEARRSDVRYVREFVDYIDIIGPCGYPVRSEGDTGGGDINRTGPDVLRWKEAGKGKPVWNVLQAFSFDELRDPDAAEPVFPSFWQSRFMAYTSITHGASGILYWGSHRMASEESEKFRESWLSLVSELSQLQPFWTAPELSQVTAHCIRSIPPGGDRHHFAEREPDSGVTSTARRFGRDWLIVLVNEDDEAKMSVEVRGLDHINGTTLELLYGAEEIDVRDGRMVTRMKPYEVKLFATSRKWETDKRAGREYDGNQ